MVVAVCVCVCVCARGYYRAFALPAGRPVESGGWGGWRCRALCRVAAGRPGGRGGVLGRAAAFIRNQWSECVRGFDAGRVLGGWGGLRGGAELGRGGKGRKRVGWTRMERGGKGWVGKGWGGVKMGGKGLGEKGRNGLRQKGVGWKG